MQPEIFQVSFAAQSNLSPTHRHFCRLSRAIERAIDHGPGEIPVHTDGARRAASLIAEMIRDPASATQRRWDFVSRSPSDMIGG